MNKLIKDLIEYPKEGIISKKLNNTDKSDTTLFCMSKGTDIEDHTSTKEGIVYVIEGNGLFTLEGKEINMIQGQLIFMNKDAVHSIKAISNTSFLLILNK